MKETIHEAVYRLKICAWAYNWDEDRLEYEVGSFIQLLQWKQYFQRIEEEERTMETLKLALNNKIDCGDPILLKEQPKNRSYGNKYIKRKNRW